MKYIPIYNVSDLSFCFFDRFRYFLFRYIFDTFFIYSYILFKKIFKNIFRIILFYSR